MHLELYTLEELHFAYCCHVYFRWQTDQRKPHAVLRQIARDELEQERPDVHVLQVEASDTEMAILASIRPTDSVATAAAAESITRRWETLMEEQRFGFRKISFVPDHVHLAIHAHPTVVPGKLVVQLLNISQDVLRDDFEHLIVRTGNPRVWKPSAYVGTFGDMANALIQAYLRRWGQDNIAPRAPA
jgi:REP element-mobilizing transposase RayT